MMNWEVLDLFSPQQSPQVRVINIVRCVGSVEIQLKSRSILPILILVYCRYMILYFSLTKGATLETLDFAFYIGNTANFLYLIVE